MEIRLAPVLSVPQAKSNSEVWQSKWNRLVGSTAVEVCLLPPFPRTNCRRVCVYGKLGRVCLLLIGTKIKSEKSPKSEVSPLRRILEGR